MLVHFDSKKVLFIDVDSSKAGGIGAMVYHVDGEIPGGKEYPQRKSIQPILFLSRLLKNAETRYWPTEMELAGVVWVLTKIRHMVDTAPKTIIYTDHGAALGIAKQTILTTSSTDKLNLSKFGPQTSLSPRIPETPNLPLYIVQGPRDSWSN